MNTLGATAPATTGLSTGAKVAIGVAVVLAGAVAFYALRGGESIKWSVKKFREGSGYRGVGSVTGTKYDVHPEGNEYDLTIDTGVGYKSVLGTYPSLAAAQHAASRDASRNYSYRRRSA